jgi:hypothetical protein
MAQQNRFELDILSSQIDKEKLQSEIENCQKTLENLKTELSKARATYNERYEEFNSIGRTIAKAKEDQQKGVVSDIQNLESKQEQARLDYNKADDTIREINAKIEETNKTITDKKGEIANIDIKMNNSREQKETYEKVNSISQIYYKETSIYADAYKLAAEDWGTSHFSFGITVTTLSAITGAGIFSGSAVAALVAGILSVVLVVISAVATFLNAEKKSNDYYKAAIDYQCLSNKAETLVDIDLKLNEKEVKDLAASLKKLKDDRDELIKISPRVPVRYYNKASDYYNRTQKSST